MGIRTKFDICVTSSVILMEREREQLFIEGRGDDRGEI